MKVACLHLRLKSLILELDGTRRNSRSMTGPGEKGPAEQPNVSMVVRQRGRESEREPRRIAGL